MEYKIPIEGKNYCKAILTILNFQLKLSPFELEILALLLTQNKEFVNTDSRDLIRKVLGKGKYNTNNYIIKLKDKGILLPTTIDRTLQINPAILELVKDKKVSFEFIVHD